MKNSKSQLYNGEKSIAIWGLGYLGYTNTIMYSSEGANLLLTDFGDPRDRLDYYLKNKYPSKQLFAIYNRSDFSNIAFKNTEAVKDQAELFKDNSILSHIICIPNHLTKSENQKEATFVDLLINNKKLINNKNIVFIIETII